MVPTNEPSTGVHTLVVLRHGPTERRDGEERLSGVGVAMAKASAEAIKQRIGDREVMVLTSNSQRAVDTGDVIAAVLGIMPQRVTWLSAAVFPSPIRTVCLDTLRHMPPNGVLIMVTHAPQVRGFTGKARVPNCEPFYDNFAT